MDAYTIEWKLSAVKELKRLPREIAIKITETVDKLATDPLPPGVRKLTGSERSFRIRVGDYRIVYDLLSKVLVIHVLRVGHRREVYDRGELTPNKIHRPAPRNKLRA